jgi:predicted MFS family arabinose efflux permease
MLLPILYTVSTLDAIGFAMVITIMNPYAESLGGTQFYLGVLGSTCAFIALIWNPIVGSLSDSLGRKKVLLQCLLICLVGNFMVTCSSSLTVLFISRTLTAFGTQIMTLLKSLVDDNIPNQESKMAAIGRMQALGCVAFVVGAVVSGHLSEYENGYTYIFYLISAIFVINISLIWLVPDKQKKKQSQKKTAPSFNVFKELKGAVVNLSSIDWPKYWDLFVIKLIIDFVLSVFQFNINPIMTRRFSTTGKTFGYIIALSMVVGIGGHLSMSRLKSVLYKNDNSGFKRLLHGSLLLTYACLGLGLATSFPMYILHLLPQSISRVIFDNTFTEMILARASPQEKGSIMGTFESTIALGGLTAPILSGLVSESWGNDMCILLCTIPLIFGTILTYTQNTKSQKTIYSSKSQ